MAELHQAHLISAAYAVDGLDDHERAVLVFLAFVADDRAEATPSVAEIADRTGKSERTVQRAIQRLVDAGRVDRRERWRQSVVYTLRLDTALSRASPRDKASGPTSAVIEAGPQRRHSPAPAARGGGAAAAGALLNQAIWDATWLTETTPTERLILAAFAFEADGNGDVQMTAARLAERTGTNERTCRRAVRTLVFQGHLTRFESRGRGVITRVHPRVAAARRDR